jgi:aldose 1-epimerase
MGRKIDRIMMTNLYFGALAESDQDRRFTLRNASGMRVTISERGAALRSWRAPDRYGRMAEVLLAGLDGLSAAGYSGTRWHGRRTAAGVELHRVAPGGAVDLQVTYRLDDDGNLSMDCHALAGLPTTVRLKAPPYFNLNGGSADVCDHMLQIDADYYAEADAAGAPTGVAVVAGTAFDFRQPAPVGARLGWPDSQMQLAGRFDHSYFVRSHVTGGQGTLRQVARVIDPRSGRCLQVYTTEAALQFCIGRRSGAPRCRNGLGLEAYAYPGLRGAAWPHIILHPGQEYRQTTVYRLSLQA